MRDPISNHDDRPVKWFNDPRAVCDYITSGGVCSTGWGCGSRGEPSCQTDAPGGVGTGSYGWPFRYRRIYGFIYPYPNKEVQ